jgi:D-alanyl-D-alanine carboxypeptidase (penicillin-binding protein 5/6)
MMRTTGAGIALALAVALTGSDAMADRPALSARAAVVMDADSGEVLWERNGREPLPPASTTKVMTAVMALESGALDEQLPVSSYAAETAPSRINLRPGQRMALRHLLYALLLNSANDAATVIAEGLGGSEAAFAARMTARAQELGARDARFANAHGLTAPGHVASARDLAVIFRHGLRLPLFRDILETPTARVPLQGAGVRWVGLRSHNRLLGDSRYPVIGKTGYTRPARRCFVGAAQRGDRELIIAILGSNDLWGDARRLLAFAYGEPEPTPVQMAKATRARATRKVPVARRTRAAKPVTVARTTRPERGEGDEDLSADARIARYTVQLGPYRTQTAALESRARLQRRGYSATLRGRALHVGSFASQTRAEQFATRLRRAGWSPTVTLL